MNNEQSNFKSKQDTAVKEALKALCETPTAENRLALYTHLTQGILYLAATNVPPGFESGWQELTEEISVSILSTTGPEDTQAVLLFTGPKEVARRNEQAQPLGMAARAAIKWGIQPPYNGIVINPGSHWAYVPGRHLLTLLSEFKDLEKKQCAWGALYLELGLVDLARGMFKQVLAINCSSTNAHFHLAEIASDRGKFDEAMIHYTEILKTNPEDLDVLNLIGTCFMDKGELEQAKAALCKLIDRHPTFVPAYINLGGILSNSGSYDEAIELFEKARSLAPDNEVLLTNLGITLMGKNRHSDAEKILDTAISVGPQYADAYYNLACAQMHLNNVSQALTNLGMACSLSHSFREIAQKDRDFDPIRNDPNFAQIVSPTELQ